MRVVAPRPNLSCADCVPQPVYPYIVVVLQHPEVLVHGYMVVRLRFTAATRWQPEQVMYCIRAADPIAVRIAVTMTASLGYL